jgi:hypothetical protein
MMSAFTQGTLRYLRDFFFGTFLPDRRASDKPMAIACLRLLTVLPERPLFKVPCLRSCIAFFTLALAPLLYFLAIRFSKFSARPVRPVMTQDRAWVNAGASHRTGQVDAAADNGSNTLISKKMEGL